MTNLEKVRSMPAEGLAFLIVYKPACAICAFSTIFCSLEGDGHSCIEGITKWLNEEAEDGRIN